MNEYLSQIMNQFRNVVLNATGVRRDFYTLINDRDISKAISLMRDRTNEINEAIREYNPQTHRVMHRPNKIRKKAEPYITEKLPRTRQRYINEVEMFFLLGAPIVWKKESGEDEAYNLFTNFLSKQYIYSKLRKLKRLAGAETEASLVFRLYRDNNNQPACNSFIAARSEGYNVRTLFDQYGTLVSLAYGYYTRESTGTVQHWDILTDDNTFYCSKVQLGWDVEVYPNPTGKINGIYARQCKSWDGVEPRLDREEHLDSKVADTNNYFADPIAAATADVVQLMNKNNQGERIGALIQLAGKDSHFGYINPPQNSEARREERANLKESILFDTFTPDFDVEKMRGFGSLSGVAIKNAMVLGYIKRARNMEDWGQYIERMIHVIINILVYLNPAQEKALRELEISFEFGEPFDSDKRELWASIANLYKNGLLSLEEAVKMLSLVKAPEEEIERLKNAQQEQMMQDMEPIPEETPAEE